MYSDKPSYATYRRLNQPFHPFYLPFSEDAVFAGRSLDGATQP